MTRAAALTAGSFVFMVAGLFLSRFLAFAGRTVVTPFYPEIGLRYGLDLATASLSLTVFYAGYAASQIPAGRLADRRSPITLIMIGAIAEGAFLVAFAYSPSWPVALAFRFLGGSAAALLYSPVYKAIQRYVSPHVRGRITGFIEMSVPTSMVATLSLDPILSTILSQATLYLMIAGLAVLTAICLLRLFRREIAEPRSEPDARSGQASLGFRTASAYVYVAVGALALAVVNGAIGWIPALLQVGLGLSNVSVGAVILVQLMAQMTGAFTAGVVSDRVRQGSLVAVRWGTVILPCGLLGLWAVSRWPDASSTSMWLWVAEVFFGFSHGFATLSCVTYANSVWMKDSGVMLSLMSTAGQVLSIVTLEGFALVYQASGTFAWLWVGAAIVAIIRLPLAWGRWLPLPDPVPKPQEVTA